MTTPKGSYPQAFGISKPACYDDKKASYDDQSVLINSRQI